MNDLLSVAVNAHGGLSWWHQLKAVKARLSIPGAGGLENRPTFHCVCLAKNKVVLAKLRAT